MNLPSLDYEAARRNMVDSQIRPNRVNDPRVLDAMRRLPRERFVPAGRAAMAYVDDDVPLGNGRYLIEPMVIARLVQIAQPVPGERALVVAAGPGYGAALLAACGAQVTALEEDEALLAAARDVLPTVAPRVAIISGPLTEGCPQGAPWDLILIEGAVHTIPPTIGSQVKREGGRLLTVLGSPGGVGQAVLAEPTVGGLRAAPQFDCGTPLLPAFAPAPSFVF